MMQHNIKYDSMKGVKGCIARCINEQKAEQNKRIQDIAKKYSCNLSSRKSKTCDADKKKPRSCDFYLGNGVVKRAKKNQAQETDNAVSFMLISTDDSSNEVAVSKRKARSNFDSASAQTKLVPILQPAENGTSPEEYPNLFCQLICRLITDRSLYLSRQSEATRTYWSQFLLTAVLTCPSDYALPSFYQELIEGILPPEQIKALADREGIPTPETIESLADQKNNSSDAEEAVSFLIISGF